MAKKKPRKAEPGRPWTGDPQWVTNPQQHNTTVRNVSILQRWLHTLSLAAHNFQAEHDVARWEGRLDDALDAAADRKEMLAMCGKVQEEIRSLLDVE